MESLRQGGAYQVVTPDDALELAEHLGPGGRLHLNPLLVNGLKVTQKWLSTPRGLTVFNWSIAGALMIGFVIFAPNVALGIVSAAANHQWAIAIVGSLAAAIRFLTQRRPSG